MSDKPKLPFEHTVMEKTADGTPVGRYWFYLGYVEAKQRIAELEAQLNETAEFGSKPFQFKDSK